MDVALQNIQAEAAAVDAEISAATSPETPAPAQTEVGQTSPPAVDPLTEARGIIGFMVVVATQVYPQLKPIYTEAVQDQLAAVTAPLLAQYGVTLGGLMGKYGNWFNFALVAGPLAVQTYQALQPARHSARHPAIKPAPNSLMFFAASRWPWVT